MVQYCKAVEDAHAYLRQGQEARGLRASDHTKAIRQTLQAVFSDGLDISLAPPASRTLWRRDVRNGMRLLHALRDHPEAGEYDMSTATLLVGEVAHAMTQSGWQEDDDRRMAFDEIAVEVVGNQLDLIVRDLTNMLAWQDYFTPEDVVRVIEAGQGLLAEIQCLRSQYPDILPGIHLHELSALITRLNT
jgi:hypothetical protein